MGKWEIKNEVMYDHEIYKFEGPGQYLGMTIIVKCVGKDEAVQKINERLTEEGYGHPLATEETVKKIEGDVIYFDNGDY